MHYSNSVYVEDIGDRTVTPPRSRLFGLEPISVGNFDAEGLISYIIRLAKAHCISPRLLVSAELLPRMREVNAVRHAEFYSDYAKTLQSTGKFANKFVEMVEQLTCRDKLSLLTTLPWQEIVPAIGTGLMTQHPKWCSACLAEHRTNRSEVYFRLSWGYALYQVCTQHHNQLTDECPWCGNHQPFFPSHACLDRCTYCYGWLGACITNEPPVNVTQQLWLSSAIEDMVIHGEQALRKVSGELFRDRLIRLVNALAGGEKTRFSEMLGFTRSTMASWITKKQKPLFPQFLYLCRQLSMMPSAFLLSYLNPDRATMNYVSRAKKLHCIMPRIGLLEPPKTDIYLRLKVIGNDPNDCRPLTDIAIELGLTRKYLIYWFQQECELISQKHKHLLSHKALQKRKEQISHVRNITWHIHKKGLYPSNRVVAKQILPFKLCFAKPHLRYVHRKTLKELGLN